MVLVLHLSILFYHSSLLFLFSLFLGFALHNIHAFHARLFLIFFLNSKINKVKERQMCLALFFLDLKSRLAILSLHNMFMYFVLFSMDEFILLHFTSLSFVVHVVWEMFIVFDCLFLILKSYTFDCWT